MVPVAPFETYIKLAVGETTMDWAFPADNEGRVKGEPESRVNSPRVVSMLKTEIEALTAGVVVP